MLRLGNHKITGNPVYGPLHQFHPEFGGTHNVINGKPYLPFYSGEWMNYMNENHKITNQDITVCSFMKSGTHWIKKICLEMLRENKTTRDHHRFDSINLVSEMPNIEFYGGWLGMDAYHKWNNETSDGFQRITHFHGTVQSFEQIQNVHPDTKLIYVARNPKDVSISLHSMSTFLTDHAYTGDHNTSIQLFLQGMTICGDWWNNIFGWHQMYEAQKYNILWLYYEDMIDDTMGTLQLIAKHIGMENSLSPSNYESIYDKVLIDNMRKEYTANPGNMWEKIDLSPTAFFRKGKVDDWKNYFDETMSHYYDSKTNIKFHQAPSIKYYQELKIKEID